MDRPEGVSNWLSDEDYEKAVGQLRLSLIGVFSPFNIYGLGDFIPGAIAEAVTLAEDFGLRVRGVDQPISIELTRRQELHGRKRGSKRD